jgi:hypothetical protein
METINIDKLFQTRVNLKHNEKKMDTESILNENEKAMLEFIASRKDGTRITDIVGENYFSNLSPSTIKRGVLKLQQTKLVKRVKTDDNRAHAMVLNLV